MALASYDRSVGWRRGTWPVRPRSGAATGRLRSDVLGEYPIHGLPSTGRERQAHVSKEGPTSSSLDDECFASLSLPPIRPGLLPLDKAGGVQYTVLPDLQPA